MHQIIPMPRNPRQMLSAFALYDATRGMASVMSRIDFAGATRRQIYFAALGRPPETAAAAAEGPKFEPRSALVASLNGAEFQRRIREILLNAFPEKRRLIFVHIPKCAGSDLLVALQRRFAYVHHHLALSDITDKPTLFAGLATLARDLPLSDGIAISGHVPLRWYQERNLLRFEDDVFTTIRHPRDILYSYISFILTRCVVFQGKGRQDVKSWLSHLGMEDIGPDASPAYLADLGAQLLRTPAVTSRNMICHYLGADTAASTFEAIVLTDIEITDVARFSAWRTQRFGFEPAARVNPSQPLFTPELATPADRALIEEMIDQDMPVYEAIIARLDASDALALRGRVFG